jgi:hypothetical protein
MDSSLHDFQQGRGLFCHELVVDFTKCTPQAPGRPDPEAQRYASCQVHATRFFTLALLRILRHMLLSIYIFAVDDADSQNQALCLNCLACFLCFYRQIAPGFLEFLLFLSLLGTLLTPVHSEEKKTDDEPRLITIAQDVLKVRLSLLFKLDFLALSSIGKTNAKTNRWLVM